MRKNYRMLKCGEKSHCEMSTGMARLAASFLQPKESGYATPTLGSVGMSKYVRSLFKCSL
jgi:hypothetical protein